MNLLYDHCDMVETCCGNEYSNMHYGGYVKQFEIRIVCSIYFTVPNAGQSIVLSLIDYILIES